MTQRKEKVEEYETIIHHLILETSDKDSIISIEQNEKFQVCIKNKIIISVLLTVRLINLHFPFELE